MAFDQPNWLDARYIENVLQNAESDEFIEVTNVDIKPATGKGDNYLSDLYRVNVKFSRGQRGHEITEETSLIVKIAPGGELRKDMVLNSKFFTTEMSMMSESLPKMNKILDRISTKTLAARCLHTQYEVPVHLIMEDLALKEFHMADRQAGLNLDHCLVALRQLAVFHASSVALHDKDPEALTKYRRGMFHKEHPASLGLFFNASTKALGEEVAKWLELSPRISEKILKLSKVLYEKSSDIIVFRENDFNVLNHGDFWVNNMMFRYDEQQKPIDLMFVDFQMSRYGSPAIDLLYFLGTSPCDDLREHKRDLLVREYYTSLTSIMAKLNCKTEAPSFDKLQGMLKERAFYEVVASCTILPCVLVDKNEQKNFDEMLKPDGTYENLGYRNKLYRKVMTRILPLFDRMGLLDS